MSPRVGVVVVSYRSRDEIAGCLEALKASASGLALDVVVVDNASNDGTPELVRERFPSVRLLVNASNRGFAAAANQGAAQASGERLLFLNPDARMAPDSLARLLSACDADPQAGLVAPSLLAPDGSPQASVWPAPGLGALAFEALQLRSLFPRARLAGVEAARAVEAACVSGACLLVRRECWEALGGFDEGYFLYHEDFDLCLRARTAGWRVRLAPDACVTHRQGASAFRDRAAFFRHFHRGKARLIAQHNPGGRGHLLAGLHLAGLALRAALHWLRGALGGGSRWRQDAGQEAAALRELLRSREP